MIDPELHGRAVIQHFFSELEKIAWSPRVEALNAGASAAARGVDDMAAHLGLSRFVPFTKGHRAYFGHVGDASRPGAKGTARAARQEAKAATDAERAAYYKSIEEGADASSVLRQMAQNPDPTQRGMSLGSKALLGTAAVGLPLGGYAGYQYLNSPPQGYGGY